MGGLKGKALDHRGLARRLREYGIKPRTICMGRGYPVRLWAQRLCRRLGAVSVAPASRHQRNKQNK